MNDIILQGKSDIAARCAAMLGLPLIDITMSEVDPLDYFAGRPYAESIYINMDQERQLYNRAMDDHLNLNFVPQSRIPGKRSKNPVQVSKRRKANKVARKQRRR